jgi:prepilin-type N-terminal cleavage/methylation domain-containing protein
MVYRSQRAAWLIRRGFTLVELMVVLMILGILASITTFALWDAQQEARRARTQAQIERIHELLTIKWESYRTRPVPVKMSKLSPEFAAKVRLNALRQLMRMELPDRISDVLDDPAPVLEAPDGTDVATMSTPALTFAYRRRVATVTLWTSTNQQAECLYMILASLQDGTSNGLDFFRQSEIGDTDDDGMPEVLDAWGRPIRFLRWAPAYLSPLQDTGAGEPDPFDVLKVDPRWKNNSAADRHFPSTQTPPYPDPATSPEDETLDDPFALFPVVFSAGPDGLYHVLIDVYDPSTVSGGLLPQDEYDLATGDYNGIPPAVTNAVAPSPLAQLQYIRTDEPEFGDYRTAPARVPSPYPLPPWPTNDIDTSAGNVFPLWQTSPRNDPYAILPAATLPTAGGVGVRLGSQYGPGSNDNIDNQTLVAR